MLNLRTDFPIRANVIDEIQSRLAQVRDMTLEVEQLLRLAVEQPKFITKNELAELLRCDIQSIPPKFRKLGKRIGGSYIYPEKDVLSLLGMLKS